MLESLKAPSHGDDGSGREIEAPRSPVPIVVAHEFARLLGPCSLPSRADAGHERAVLSAKTLTLPSRPSREFCRRGSGRRPRPSIHVGRVVSLKPSARSCQPSPGMILPGRAAAPGPPSGSGQPSRDGHGLWNSHVTATWRPLVMRTDNRTRLQPPCPSPGRAEPIARAVLMSCVAV